MYVAYQLDGFDVSIRMQRNDVNDDVIILTLSRNTYGDTVLQ
jgi:hypothetical protein